MDDGAADHGATTPDRGAMIEMVLQWDHGHSIEVGFLQFPCSLLANLVWLSFKKIISSLSPIVF
jgi:hypothetical protein